MPTPEYHADRSPSSAKQWLNCTPSLRLSDGIPRTTSEYAEAGRLAHSIAELKARKRFMVLSKRSFGSQLKKLQEDPNYSPEMDGYTDLYVETLEQHAMTFKAAPFIALETSVPIGVYTMETKPDGLPATGTADCIQIGEGVLWVTDYKNGAGVPVSAEDNPQMKIYALGALALYAPIYGDTIQTVKMTIVQSALNSVSDWEISRGALKEWGHDVLTPAAHRAAKGEGEPNPGDWCRFCPAKFQCRARAQQMFQLETDYQLGLPAGMPDAMQTSPGPLLTDSEVGDALTRGAALVAWYNDLKDYALQACLEGKEIPGFKAVAGRTAREWDSLDSAFIDLQLRGIDAAVLWERKPVTPPALEKAIGKKTFEQVAVDHVIQTPGKPTLASASDKRPAYNAAQIAFGGTT